MNDLPPFLKPGDTIAVVAPARKISLKEIEPFIKLAQTKGFNVVYSDDLFASDHQFAGGDSHRAKDFQFWLENENVQAIISARGGYGTARMVDEIDWKGLEKSPKWLIGFSDFTVIHCHVNRNFHIPTLHATMPIFLKDKSNEEVILSFEKMFQILLGHVSGYPMPENDLNIKGNCEGVLIGGNLSVIYSIMGSTSEIDTQNAILFLEDLDEYLYHVDRMMVGLRRSGKLNQLKGLIIGHMNSMHDNPISFGKTAYEIIKEHAQDLGIPIYFGFDSGHLNPNLPLIFGHHVHIENNYLNFGGF